MKIIRNLTIDDNKKLENLLKMESDLKAMIEQHKTQTQARLIRNRITLRVVFVLLILIGILVAPSLIAQLASTL